MFYYPHVLQRHTGCFATIWLAATRGIRVTRREFLTVNVKRTCMEILDYVTAQVPPPQPNQSRPRFSLYLSSQLQYGVVVVYHKQCGFLLEEMQHTIDRLLRCKRYVQIDVAEAERMALDLPDGLNMMEEAEGAQDPFFGLMESDQLPSPYKIHQMEFVIEDLAVRSPHMTLIKEGFDSPLAAITLTEKEQFVINTAECFEGDELPEATVREIDLLMNQPDQFRREEDREKTEDRTRDQGLLSSIGLLKETTLGTERDSVWLQDEETGQLVEVPLTTVAMEMTPPHVALPSESVGDAPAESSCDEMVAPPLRRHPGGRSRQLVFVDPEVQVSNKVMQEQIGNPRIETKDLFQVLLDLSSLTITAPSQLFGAPCGSLLHPDLLSLWKQQASLAVLPESGGKQRADGESEQDVEVPRTERKRRHSCMKEISSESGLQPSEAEFDVMQDTSKEDKSGSDVITPVSRWSPQEDIHPPMDPIAEEAVEFPEAQTDTEDRNMLSWITSTLQRHVSFTFDMMLPPEADRCTAAQTLYKLLELLTAKQLSVYQTEPYSDIIIQAGALRMAD